MADAELLISDDDAPPEVRVAIAHAPAELRGAVRTMLALDRQFASILATTSEPMLGQVRLAWWRDRLTEPLETMPKGNPLLEAISATWGPSRVSLAPLADGWEALLVADDLDDATIFRFAEGREAAWSGLAGLARQGARTNAIRQAARVWALGDLASNISDPDEKALVLSHAETLAQAALVLPRKLRPLAILGSLARRSLALGGAPLLGDRGAALTAFRVGIFGR
ncbi:squalene/phytoene synthase family protein [Qipengyuania zhejiangensis]|uniref:squalene/phytoene synthase family protein n=1 Tax=Qipengyuania zhejiangensis TaxID=3077782 RepID=UPI002D77F0A7|nr:squalene/phytoene synthase family protein [Qipengyuania sp. Z2]